MADLQSFLRAMVEAPEDDTPRLVYADWLEEFGDDADRDRAEFIRVQCELSGMRIDSPEHVSRSRSLRSRAFDLEQKYGKQWVAELKLPKNRHTYPWFRRGMVSRLWCTVRYFIQHAASFLDVTPIEVVCLRQGTLRNFRELGRKPIWSRVPGVEFLMDETSAEDITGFLGFVPLGGLRSLTLDKRTIVPSAPGWYSRNVALAQTIAQCGGLSGLRRLHLNHTGVGDEGALALARSPHLAGLEVLDLSNNAPSPEVEAELRERFGKRLCLGKPDWPNFTVGQLSSS